ncbi:MAG: CopD family protein, partial [Chloroflexota bacterium]|nr:CopD family protein [Chloroflexota bacterium]
MSMLIRWISYLAVAGVTGLVAFPLLVLRPLRWEAGTPNGRRAGQVTARCGQGAKWLAAAGTLAAAAMLVDQAARSGGLNGSALVATLGTRLGMLLLARVAVALALLGLLLVGVFPRSQWSPLPTGEGNRPYAHPDPVHAGDRRVYRHRSLGAAAVADFNASGLDVPVRQVASVGLVLLELLLFALTSHALAVPAAPELALFVDWMHLILASFWLGGLAALSLALAPTPARTRAAGAPRPDEAGENVFFGPVLARFSHLALTGAAGLALTGLYQGVVHVGSLDNVLSTDYGRALAVKTAFFALALLVAGFHRFVIKPALMQPRRAQATRARRFSARTLPLEALLIAAVLAATGVLTALAPANDQAAASGIMTKNVGGIAVKLQIQPLQVGPNQFQVTLQSNGQAITNAEKVELTANMLDMD